MLQEHRLHKQQYHDTCRQLRRYFHVIMRPAITKNQAPSGGATILIRKDLTVVPGYCPRAQQDMTSNSMMACLRVKGCNMIFVSAYLNPSNPHIRYQTMQSISNWIGYMGCPWMVAGDFNTPQMSSHLRSGTSLGRGLYKLLTLKRQPPWKMGD